MMMYAHQCLIDKTLQIILIFILLSSIQQSFSTHDCVSDLFIQTLYIKMQEKNENNNAPYDSGKNKSSK